MASKVGMETNRKRPGAREEMKRNKGITETQEGEEVAGPDEEEDPSLQPSEPSPDATIAALASATDTAAEGGPIEAPKEGG